MIKSLILFTFVVISVSPSQTDDSTFSYRDSLSILPLPVLIPLDTYVTCGPEPGGTEETPASITLNEALQLQVNFSREMLPKYCGVQFLTVVISIFDKHRSLNTTTTKFAFTYPLHSNDDSDRTELIRYSKQIIPFGFFSEKKIRRVIVLNDTIPEWSLIKIEVTPDNEYTKYADRLKYKMEWWYRVKGGRFETEFFLGIPKVLYDTRSDDTMTYGNSSAMLRFYYLHSETGERFPINIGAGTIGVSTPIDVTDTGGGFAVSLMFDVVQSIRTIFAMNITEKVNAGIELTPFFPLKRSARLLVNARIGYSP